MSGLTLLSRVTGLVRDLVIARLARLGARIVDAPAARLGPALISAYLDIKRSDVL